MSRSTIWLRISVTLSLLFLGVLVAISGVILYFAPSGKGSGGVIMVDLTKRRWISIHDYSGFIMIGLVPIHVFLNRRPLLAYLKKLFKG
ncbi:MAG: hypothetical protein DRO00_01690 [Thermoproteota archaeon]|nr:MAG: hypothetical protein DRN92_02685 [Candidatus Korarchaeota archaeon]RLG54292.1 MAG: hypothetical protein DRO00_01690 [Candidatus Korarchaeota archaeon]